MIERYRLQQMHHLFTDEAKFNNFLRVEIAALEAFSTMGIIPIEAVNAVKKHAAIDVDRIRTIEEETKHDVIAFTRAVSETLQEEKKWLHYGLTSTDVVDTAFSLTLKEANDIIFSKINTFMTTLKKLAYKFQDTPCIGRTHGIHADVTSFGLKFTLFYDEFSRHLQRFNAVRNRIEVGKISGAVGNFAHTPPQVQDSVCDALELQSANISTQTLQRDRHAEYMSVLVLIASSIDKIAVEIRHLQRTEVREVSEAFSLGQKGSSAMPHKKNPIASENMSGCARIMRGYLTSVFENIALWHERDISHSSVERVVIPDALQLLDYMLERYNKVLSSLVVYPERMLENIYMTHGVIFSQRVMHALIDRGFSRENAYDLIQPLAIIAYEQRQDFMLILKEDVEVMKHLDGETLDSCFTLEYYLKQVPTIFSRVFKELD